MATRDDSDFSIALLDAFAVTADILTFYQERLANESYLRTAMQQRSVFELAQQEDLPRLFRPEFLNRVDEVINFHRLTQDELKKIVDIQLETLRVRLEERHIDLQLTDAARAHLVTVGYDPAYGARPLKRAIQKEVETPLARMLVAGEIRDGKKVLLDFRKDELVFEVESPKAVRAS